jgi:hypothetical protein
MIPTFEQRDDLLKVFAKALFRRDLDALYEVVTPDFLWSFHDGLSLTKSLVGRAQRGVELYRFRDGKLALKDVYRKPIAG